MLPPEMMNTSAHNTTTAKIQLNETFLRLVSGSASICDIVAERAAAHIATLAREDDYARRHREFAEARDMFFVTCAR